MKIYEVILLHMQNAFEFVDAARTEEAMAEFMAACVWARKRPQFKNTAEFCLQRAEILEFMLDNDVGRPPVGPTHDEPQWAAPIVRDNATYNAGFAEGIKYACIVVASIIQNSQVKLPDDDAYNPMGEAFLHGLRRMSEEAWMYRGLQK
jgi:hypothetical protein